MTTYIVMGTMETGEIARFCDTDFDSREAAQGWIDDNWERYPECGSSFYVEPMPSDHWEPDDDSDPNS